jgi:hypothetical protein
MGLPVNTVAAGGIAVVDVTATLPKMGAPVSEALPGKGTAVTKVAAFGVPVTFEIGGVVTPPTSAEAAAFLARTSGLDATHTSAYTALIDGLVADGLWPKLDVLHIYATQNTATAQLNLVSGSYPASLNGSPAFTADRGYTGIDGSSTVYINTGFNPTTAPSAKFTQNLAHLSAWNLVNATQANPAIGIMGSIRSMLHIRYITDVTFYELNGSYDGSGGVSNTDARGHHLVNRTTSTNVQGYRNGSSVVSSGTATTGLPNLNIYSLGANNGGTPAGAGVQLTMASIGSSLSSTQATNFYNRLRTYMTAVGVP